MADFVFNDGVRKNDGQPLSIVDKINGMGERATNAIIECNFKEARKFALATLALLALVPDGDKQGEAGASLRWDRQALQSLITQIAELEGHCRAPGIQTASLNFEPVAGNDHGCCSHRDQRRHDDEGRRYF